ncbi:MAG TPA: DUF3575 domain-containing protein [Flavobacterium sp.]|jgi:hypothetical protein
MKKIMFCTLMAWSCLSYAQETETPPIERRDEVKINALLMILGAIEVGYEHTLSHESAFGITGLYGFDDDLGINYMITPYYRYYFGKKPAHGFFMEGFGTLNSVDDYVYEEYDPVNFYYNYEEKTITDFALGIGLGAKWMTSKGVTLEINAGIGRNLFSGEEDRDFEIIGRGGISVGYRF